MPNKTTVLSIFGASGDLAKLMLFPAVYVLAYENKLPDDFFVFGFARSEIEQDEFKKIFIESVKKKHSKIYDEEIINKLIDKLYYVQGQYDDLEAFNKLRNQMEEKVGNSDFTNIAYFSVPPFVFWDVVKNLAESRKTKEDDVRLVIEKPFGNDYQSAEELYHYINTFFDPPQIYLLDHYLGKRAVQSLMHMRHANKILNSMIHGFEVANIQYTAMEDFGVSNRVDYFESVGLIKDYIQSHVLQVLALITMDIPVNKVNDTLSREKYNILSALKFPRKKENIFLGQYESYRGHGKVPADSKTETFAAMKLFIDKENWYNVPIYIRAGKRLQKDLTYVVVELEKFEFQNKMQNMPANKLVFQFNPEKRMDILMYNRLPDGSFHEMNLSEEIPCQIDTCLDEHAVLLEEVIKGEALYFLDFSEVLASWKLIDDVQQFIKEEKITPEHYEDGIYCPSTALDLPKRDGFEWHEL